jgi:TonB family protein
MNSSRPLRSGVLTSTRMPRQPTVLEDGVAVWTRQRWLTTVAMIFVAQVLALLLLGRRAEPPAASAPPNGRVMLLPAGHRPPPPAGGEGLPDPAEFALVSSRGFSAEVWFRRPTFARPATEWLEPPRFLSNQELPAGISGPPLALPRSFFSQGQAPEPAARTGILRPLVATNSTVQVEGLPPDRPARWPELPPDWEHPDVLQPSLVQVTVDEHGSVLMATLLASSGLAAADQKALELARNTVFAPLPDAGGPRIHWGRLSFQWRTVAPGGAPR